MVFKKNNFITLKLFFNINKKLTAELLNCFLLFAFCTFAIAYCISFPSSICLTIEFNHHVIAIRVIFCFQILSEDTSRSFAQRMLSVTAKFLYEFIRLCHVFAVNKFCENSSLRFRKIFQVVFKSFFIRLPASRMYSFFFFFVCSVARCSLISCSFTASNFE